jgi:hypothetical protein
MSSQHNTLGTPKGDARGLISNHVHKHNISIAVTSAGPSVEIQSSSHVSREVQHRSVEALADSVKFQEKCNIEA